MAVLTLLKISKAISFTTVFMPIGSFENDFRYKIGPKKVSTFQEKEYIQVFNNGNGFSSGLSILDLIFNIGPDSCNYL
jgi:hypothetical protein